MSEKIVFLDVDGTIRHFDGTIPESTFTAVRRARENGHKVFVCTGRPYFQVDDKVKSIEFDGCISDVGAYVEYEGECLRHQYFPKDLYLELCQHLIDNGCIVELQRHDRNFVPIEVEDRYQKLIDGFVSIMGEGGRALANKEKFEEDYKSVEGIEKILFFSDQEFFERFWVEWEGRLHKTIFSIPIPDMWGGELSPNNVKKKEGIVAILEKLGATKDDAIAIGDSDNDIDMLEYCGIGVAMGNGTEGAKAAADMITDNLMDDGIYNAFKKIGLI